LEREAPLRPVELRRRDAEIEQDAVDPLDPACIEDLAQIAEIGVDELDPGLLGSRRCRVGVDGDDAAAERGDGAGVPAEAVGGIDVEPARGDGEGIDSFEEQDGDMRVNRARAPA
jgi:hypothetical protein